MPDVPRGPRRPTGSARARYGRWEGGPDPLAPPHDVRAAVDELGDDVLDGVGAEEALRDLLRRGPADEDRRRRGGLDDLLAAARRRRRELARSGSLDGSLTAAAAALDQAVATERDALAGRDDDDARFAETRLDSLPRSTAGAVKELTDYTWASEAAAQQFRELLDRLRSDALGQQFRGLRDALKGRSAPGEGGDGEGSGGEGGDQSPDTERLRAMLTDLNGLLDAHSRGEDTTEAFTDFMARHGDLVGGDPQDTEELIDELARRAADTARLMNSLSGSQRAELADLMSQALAGSGVAAELGELGDRLRALRPGLDAQRAEQVRGEQPLGYSEAADVVGELGELDALIDQFGQDHPGATLDDVDVDAVERRLGRSAAQDVQRLRDLERELERQGWLTRTSGAAELQLSPAALRRIAGTALREVFSQLTQGGRGDHDDDTTGAAGEVTGTSRPWEFGDTQPIDAVRTVVNAVRRGQAARSADGDLVLIPDDMAVVETERRSGAAVALCVDLSYSMAAEGRWGPMKRTALALAQLVATRFPQDSVQIIGFGRLAHRLDLAGLAAVEPAMEQGTNLQHALRIAGRHLRRHPDATPVVLVVTDGEPTAHLVSGSGSGTSEGVDAMFHWPPLPETVQATVVEVDHLARYGTQLSFFLLGDDAGLARFVDAVARRSGGRVLNPDTDDLGQVVVADYLRSRRR